MSRIAHRSRVAWGLLDVAMNMMMTIQTCWPGEVVTQAFTSFPITIGRDTRSSLRLPQRFVSRHHARIERVGDMLVLVDANSRGGTVYCGRTLGRNERVPLVDGSEIRIQWLVLRVRLHEASGVLQIADRGKPWAGGSGVVPRVRSAGGPASGADPHPGDVAARGADVGRLENPAPPPSELAPPALALLEVLRQLGVGLGDRAFPAGREPRSAVSELQGLASADLPVGKTRTEPNIEYLLERLEPEEPGVSAPAMGRVGNQPTPGEVGPPGRTSGAGAVVISRMRVVRLFRGIMAVVVHAIRALLARPPRVAGFAPTPEFAQAVPSRPARHSPPFPLLGEMRWLASTAPGRSSRARSTASFASSAPEAWVASTRSRT